MGAVAGHDAPAGGQRHAGHVAGHPRRDRGLFHLRDVAGHVGLFRGLPVRVAHGARDDPPGGACARLRGAGLDDLGSDDPLSGADRSLRLGGGAHPGGFLFLRCLRDCRKLAQQCRRQREPRQGAFALHDRSDGRHRQRAGTDTGGRSGRLRAVHPALGADLAGLRADPALDQPDTGIRNRQAD